MTGVDTTVSKQAIIYLGLNIFALSSWNLLFSSEIKLVNPSAVKWTIILRELT